MSDLSGHLLLIDDEAGFREAIADRLQETGFTVAQAGTGEEALERLRQFAFDILITDLRLPGVDGRTVLCRFLWTSDPPRWEQAFSDDGGKTWETNWIMEFTRA